MALIFGHLGRRSSGTAPFSPYITKKIGQQLLEIALSSVNKKLTSFAAFLSESRIQNLRRICSAHFVFFNANLNFL